MPRFAVALLALIAGFFVAVTATAAHGRIAVLQSDAELLRAISLAFLPWGLETIRSDAPVPKASQPEAVQMAGRLGRDLDVDALVWVTSMERGSLLWVFDVRTGDVTTRLLAETPPFDSAAAAAVALSVKTVLRASVVAPLTERYGFQPSAPSVRRVSAVQLGLGGHWLDEQDLESRIELAGLLWLRAAPRFGLSLQLSAGPGLRIEHPAYGGRYRDFALGGRARYRLIDVQGFSAAASLGGAAHLVTLEGTEAATSRESSAQRLNTSFDFGISFDFGVTSRLYLGAAIDGAYLLRHRRYLVRDEPVFAPWRLSATLAGYCGVELF